jgi:hypothetical protein
MGGMPRENRHVSFARPSVCRLASGCLFSASVRSESERSLLHSRTVMVHELDGTGVDGAVGRLEQHSQVVAVAQAQPVRVHQSVHQHRVADRQQPQRHAPCSLIGRRAHAHLCACATYVKRDGVPVRSQVKLVAVRQLASQLHCALECRRRKVRRVDRESSTTTEGRQVARRKLPNPHGQCVGNQLVSTEGVCPAAAQRCSRRAVPRCGSRAARRECDGWCGER